LDNTARRTGASPTRLDSRRKRVGKIARGFA